jgi:pSer/pThr/pTyr-binding forkhead associated (FHA) protein
MMNELTVSLLLERGPQTNQRFVLTGEQSSIGRSSANDVVIVDPEVSRRHARIVHRKDQLALEDLGSTNGTFLNGQRVTHLTALQDGDLIDLGDSISLRVMTAVTVASNAPAIVTATEPDYLQEPSPSVDETAIEWNAAVEDPGDFVFYSGPEAERLAKPEPSYGRQEQAFAPQPISAARPRRAWVGCLLAIVAVSLLCVGTAVLLDAYDQGRLLYCGPLRPIFEVILGPFGFAPACS